MKRILSIVIWNACFSMLLGLMSVGCQKETLDMQQGRKFTVIVDEGELYQRPDRLSQKVATLHFDQEVIAIEKKRPTSSMQGWEEVHVGRLSNFFSVK